MIRMKQNQEWIVITVAKMESLAAKVIISAQETTPGHSASTRLLILSMKPNPLTVRFGGASFSAWFVVEFRSTDASQPLTKQSWKCILMRAAAKEGAFRIC